MTIRGEDKWTNFRAIRQNPWPSRSEIPIYAIRVERSIDGSSFGRDRTVPSGRGLPALMMPLRYLSGRLNSARVNQTIPSTVMAMITIAGLPQQEIKAFVETRRRRREQ